MTNCDHCGAGYNEDSVMACTDEHGSYCCGECRDVEQTQRAIAYAESREDMYA